MSKKPGLRKYINEHCKGCIYDCGAAGTWRQQVTLCTIKSCELYPVRPVTKSPIPESVLNYYFVPEVERAFYRRSRPPEGPITEHNKVEECPSEG